MGLVKGNIVLIGMMGTFKSSAGKVVAERLGMLFLDTDDLIEFEYNLKISQIFERYGEEFFRELESRIVRRVSEFENVVISTGGGVVLDPANMDALSQNAVVVLLSANAEEIFSRIGEGSNRPLGRSLEDIRRLLKERDEAYRAYADFVVDNSGKTSKETAELVVQKVGEFRAVGGEC